jgi:diguanylate cyclase (GGDEF)-like protein/PAS domain S-box-containing protein
MTDNLDKPTATGREADNALVTPTQADSSQYSAENAGCAPEGQGLERGEYVTGSGGDDLRFRTLFWNMSECACVLKAVGGSEALRDYRILDINPAGLAAVNTIREAVVGKTLQDLLPDGKEQAMAVLREALQGGLDLPRRKKSQIIARSGRTWHLRAFVLADGEIGVLFSDESEQENIKKQLLISEQKYREITDNLTDVIWQCDLDNHMIYISPSIARLTGVSAEDYRNRPFGDMFPPDAAEAVLTVVREELAKENIAGARSDRPRIFEARHRLPNGRIAWLSMSISLLRDTSGKAIGIQGSARDISAQKKAADMLRESEESHRLLFESMAQGVVYRSRDGIILTVNPALLRMTGFEEAELVGMRSFPSRWAHIKEDGMPFPISEFPSSIALRTGKPFGPCVMGGIHGKTGERVWLSLNAIPVFRDGEAEASQIYTIFNDITDRINAQTALLQSRDLMRYIVENSRSSIAVLDQDMKYLYVSRQYMAEWYGNESSIIGRQHYELNPNIPSRWKDAYKRALAGEAVSNEEDYISDANGNPLWIRWDCYPWYKGDDSIGGIILNAENITKRKSTEEALRLSEEMYRLIAENVSDVIWVFNVERDCLTYISPSIARMSSYTAEEILAGGGGKGLTDDPFPLQRDRIAAAALTLKTSTAGPRTLLYESRRATEARPCLWTEDAMTARYNVAGEIEVFGVSRDISARKENEENLRYMSYHDQLTGLYNRRFFEEELGRLDTPRRFPLSIIMGDVNGLKIVNDSFGHEAGDELLTIAAELFRKACRADDIIARLGGDEFVILLPETSTERADQVIARIKSMMADIKVKDIDVSISFGSGTKDAASQNIRDVLSDVENQMYRHKLYERKSMRSSAVDAIMNALFQKSSRELLHSQRVSGLCREIATRCGFEKTDVSRIGMAGLLHDIGKIGVDEKILNKRSRLTDEEWPEIRRHPETGWRILSATVEFNELARFVLEHQENWDGSGYPKGLKREEIAREARIIRIADSYDAMTHTRVFSSAFSPDQAAEELHKNADILYDPAIVEAFLKEGPPVIAD